MKLTPDKLGGSPKQYAALGGLLVLGLISYLVNRTPSGPTVQPPARPAAAPQDPVAIQKIPARKAASRTAGTRRAEEFRPSLKPPEGTDVTKIDPTIKLALLTKVRNSTVEPGSRGSVFAFGQPPPPPPLKVAPIKPGTMPTPTANNTPPPPTEVKPTAPVTQTAPPVPLKFYGFSGGARGGPKRAFFLDGEDIVVVSENDVVKNRYKIIRIGINSVVVEDMNFKSQQTVPLIEELAG
jgi:hypothetical protein